MSSIFIHATSSPRGASVRWEPQLAGKNPVRDFCFSHTTQYITRRIVPLANAQDAPAIGQKLVDFGNLVVIPDRDLLELAVRCHASRLAPAHQT